MKNFILTLSLLLFGVTFPAFAVNSENHPAYSAYGEAFIFTEHGVEFAVYPDGQFDFYFNPNNNRHHFIAPAFNMSFNSGYNYGPYVQLDDYGAVIQIESVPVYYDYYGRIIRAGDILISYNNYGKVSRIGDLIIFYDPHLDVSHTVGFINRYNQHYVNRVWHQYYRRPYQNHIVVFHQPYRAYYFPERIAFNSYFQYYNESPHYNNYYRPGQDIISYHRGRRTSNVRDLSRINEYSREPVISGNEIRSNENTRRTSSNSGTREVRRSSSTNRERNTKAVRSTSERGRNDIRSTHTRAVPEVEKRRDVRRSSPTRVERPNISTRNVAPHREAVRTPEPVSPRQATPARSSRSTRGRG